MRKTSGFTLIEVLIVLAVIALIAAIAIPNMLLAIQRSKQKRAMAEIRGIATACSSYATDTNKFPLASTTWTDSLTVIPVGELAPMYIKEVPNPDPWQRDYDYASTARGMDFGVRSLGFNSKVDGGSSGFTSVINDTVTATGCFENDIIWVNETFLYYPEGKQRRCD